MPRDQHQSKFTMRNEAFVCRNCHKEVRPLAKGCRNHCPYCFYSLHVDIFPGDRMSSCGGLLKPIGYEYLGRNGIDIVFRCCSCQQISKNKAALDDPDQPDSYDILLSLNN